MDRYLADQIRHDLKEKMVFVAGPRQVGKTTLALGLLKNREGYLNWDIPEHRTKILSQRLPRTPLLALDEIHKYRLWRSFLKGLYDDKKNNQHILVTGSAKLGYYHFGGDSLQGRYHLLRMHPLTVAELGLTTGKDFEELLKLNGFPEPFFRGNQIGANRWSMEYQSRLIREEITGLETVHDLTTMEMLSSRLPDLVGAPLSVNALREDLQVNHATVVRWLEIFERIYALFRLSPLGAPRIRAVKKEQKHYHFDWNLIQKKGPRFENLLAVHLLKWVQFEVDTKARRLELRYFRDVEGREVDFVVTERDVPLIMVEAKWSDEPVSGGLRYLKGKFPDAEAWQVSAMGTWDDDSPQEIRRCPAVTFLKRLI